MECEETLTVVFTGVSLLAVLTFYDCQRDEIILLTCAGLEQQQQKLSALLAWKSQVM